MTILGTRPEIIRLALIIKKLDKFCEKHILVHTGQNYDKNLSDVFFKDLELRQPNYYLGVKENTRTKQVTKILEKTEELILKEKPDRILILGDTNSGLSVIPASFHKIPVFHMEAGNRCFDEEVPEEKNRILIDNQSQILLPYTRKSKQNLLKEGFNINKILVSGNPIFEVLEEYKTKIDKSKILNKLNLKDEFALVTFHRSENVDNLNRLQNIFSQLNEMAKKMIVLVSVHPRTRSKLKNIDFKPNPNLRLLEPLPFFDFVKLEKKAKIILTDSGTVQEEACIFRKPSITLRKTTERPETIECGSNVLFHPENKNLKLFMKKQIKQKTDWKIPEEYLISNVSDIITNIILSTNI